MSKKAPQSSDWNFTVRQIQLRHPISQALLEGQFGNFRDDTGECLGTTSEQYGIIQNATLMDMARAALEKRGLTGYTERILATGDRGQRFFAEFTFANKQLASGVGDIFGYKLILKNSFDRSLRAAFSLGFLRLVCLNGASTLEKEFSVTRKHSAKVSTDFLGNAIDAAIANGHKALSVFDDMAATEISDEQGLTVLANLVASDVLSSSLRESIKTLWLAPRRAEDKARNLYNLYNSVTEHLTHQVAQERFEYADKVSGNVLVRLAQASRNKDRLAKLLIPVPVEGVAITMDAGSITGIAGANIIDVETVG